LDVDAIRDLPDALRRRAIRVWLLGGGASGLTDSQIRAVDALVSSWRGQGGVAVSSDVPRTRLFAERHGGTLTLLRKPV
jgi:tRNA(Ile)-lysidine synthase